MRTRGFTLIEILIVIGMIAILAAVVLVAVNPLRQFAQARNSQRLSNVSAILNAISERIADNKGIFQDTGSSCASALPTSATDMESAGGYDVRPCLVPTYLSELPYDPASGSNTCSGTGCAGNGEGYDTGYTILQDPTTSRITVCAPGGAESSISGSSAICLTR
jgi:type IV pilus assembly protein PilA